MTHKFIDFVSYKFDHPAVTAALIGAGAAPSFLPTWFTTSPVQTLYYLVLLPPAAWSSFVWFKNIVWPGIKKIFKR